MERDNIWKRGQFGPFLVVCGVVYWWSFPVGVALASRQWAFVPDLKTVPHVGQSEKTTPKAIATAYIDGTVEAKRTVTLACQAEALAKVGMPLSGIQSENTVSAHL